MKKPKTKRVLAGKTFFLTPEEHHFVNQVQKIALPLFAKCRVEREGKDAMRNGNN